MRRVPCISLRWTILAGLALPLLTGGAAARGDVFVLTNGGRVEGTWLNRDRRPREPYVIEIARGSKLAIEPADIRSRIPQNAAELEYNRRAPSFADTVEAQWQLAEWCRSNKLRAQRETHLRRILELDPDHVEARYALGYRQIQGQWMTQAEFRRSQGYELYRGRWRLSQDIELIERRRERDIAEKEWKVRLKRWRADLATERALVAREQILAIRDRHAVPAISEALEHEPLRPVKLVYVSVLGEIGSDAAAQTLIHLTMNDPDEEVFHAALDEIVAAKIPGVQPIYGKALQDQNNVRINRAAIALKRLGDKSSIGPLIDALVTTHTIVIPGNHRSPDSISASFARNQTAGPLGSSGLSTGDNSRVLRQTVTNQEVLDALVKLSGGVNFGFDERAWSLWYSAENKQHPPLSARRDDRP